MSTQHVSFQQASPNEQAVILIVDDVPENLGLLHESLIRQVIACLLQPMG